MKRKIIIYLFITFCISEKHYGQELEGIKDSTSYVVINEAVIPYLLTQGELNIQIAERVVQTVFHTEFYDGLYAGVIEYLKNDLLLDKQNIKFIIEQIKNENQNLKWEQNKIIKAYINDTLFDYENFHFSKPIISKDNKFCFIVKFRSGKPSGRCGTVDSYFTPMLFKKENNTWEFVKSFKDERKH